MQYNVFEHIALKDMKEVKKRIKRGELPSNSVEMSLYYTMAEAVKIKDTLTIGDVAILLAYHYGEVNHIFIENDKLYELLKKSEVRDQIDVDELIASGIMKKQNAKLYPNNEAVETYGAIIHGRDTKSAIAVELVDGRKIDGGMTMYIGRSNDITVLAKKQLIYDPSIENVYEGLNNEEDSMERIRIVHNLSMYIRAYNNVIREGVPESPPQKYEKNKSKIIKVSNEIQEHLQEVTPHMRRGYFKKLESEFYSNKRGEIVYVKATFVRGKAKTVETEVER